MRTVLLALGLLCAAAAIAACETQPLLARCENNYDCDRSMTPTSVCVPSATRVGTCMGGDCYCCPTNLAAATDPTVMMRCMTMVQPVDAVVIVDATGEGGDAPLAESGGDAGSDADAASTDAATTDAPSDMGPGCAACIKGLQYCDNGTCRALRSEGLACASGAECRSTFCVGSAGAGVCCDLACTTPGWSCAGSATAPAGRCAPVASVPDAGVPDVGAIDATAD